MCPPVVIEAILVPGYPGRHKTGPYDGMVRAESNIRRSLLSALCSLLVMLTRVEGHFRAAQHFGFGIVFPVMNRLFGDIEIDLAIAHFADG